MISSKGKLGPYHMHVKLAIIIHCIKLSSEVTCPVDTKRKKMHIYLRVPPVSELYFFGYVGMCANES